MNRRLLILGCSSVKVSSHDLLPAISRYDGPYYRVIGSFLNQSMWPGNLSIAILSAKYGLIGGLTPIECYDQRMDKVRAAELQPVATETLRKWSLSHQIISLVLGKDYLPALDLRTLQDTQTQAEVIQGPIGVKLNFLYNQLRETGVRPRPRGPTRIVDRPLYFLPDWDDMLDVNYNFEKDQFSHTDRSKRTEKHCIQVMQPKRICDGVVVSLAQHRGTKGILRKFSPTDLKSLAPESIRDKYGLVSNQWAFGDCGAFSYVNEPSPPISTEQALSLYQLYGFDMGSSVDHIPVKEIVTEKGKHVLSEDEKKTRIKITKENAREFITLHKQKGYTFNPVGVIQGLSPKNYAEQLPEYAEMGYNFLAIGGLVPRSDKEIVEIITEISKERDKLSPSIRDNLWIHLFGVFRPEIQEKLRCVGVASFDSATYFRKAWLRSGQNYLGTDGEWYAAIRVPLTSDARTLERLKSTGRKLIDLQKLEAEALNALHEYDKKQRSLDSTLDAITQYDLLLERSYDDASGLRSSYKQTLESRIWEKCECPICKQIGIDVVIFRGYNRNKRRGAHNTLALYKKLGGE